MWISRVYDRLIVGLAVLAGVSYGFATLAIIVDVVLRNLDLPPFQSTSALVEYVLLLATMASGPWLMRQGAHVAVNSFVNLLPTGLAGGVRWLAIVLAVATLVLLSWRAGVVGLDEWRFGSVDMRSINIPGWLAYAMLSAGFGLMALEICRMAWRGQRILGGSASH